jgi:hypothetical protein
MYIRCTSDGLGAPAGRLPPLVPPRDLGRPRVEGDAIAAALDGPAPPSSRGCVRGPPTVLRPRPVFGGMVDKWAFGVARQTLLERAIEGAFFRTNRAAKDIRPTAQLCAVHKFAVSCL